MKSLSEQEESLIARPRNIIEICFNCLRFIIHAIISPSKYYNYIKPRYMNKYKATSYTTFSNSRVQNYNGDTNESTSPAKSRHGPA